MNAIDILLQLKDRPFIFYILMMVVCAKYVFIPMRKFINRGYDILEMYFAIHEKEIGHLMGLCDRLEEILVELRKPKPIKAAGLLWRIFDRRDKK